jgi:hypothetical protein
MNGTQCGSPALRNRRQCFFHERIQRERAKIAKDMSAQRRFDLPLLEDANSVQVALMNAIQMLGAGRIDHKTAGLMLYALQTASVNLRNAEFEADEATDVVIDRDDVHRTSLGGPQWFEEDFEDDSEEEDELEGESDGEDAVAAAEVKTAAVPKKAAEVKHVSLEEARSQVHGVVRDWLLETARENAAAEPS